MPTLIVENVPPDVYERLQQRAAPQQRTLLEETLYLLQQVLRSNAIAPGAQAKRRGDARPVRARSIVSC